MGIFYECNIFTVTYTLATADVFCRIEMGDLLMSCFKELTHCSEWVSMNQQKRILAQSSDTPNPPPSLPTLLFPTCSPLSSSFRASDFAHSPKVMSDERPLPKSKIREWVSSCERWLFGLPSSFSSAITRIGLNHSLFWCFPVLARFRFPILTLVSSWIGVVSGCEIYCNDIEVYITLLFIY